MQPGTAPHAPASGWIVSGVLMAQNFLDCGREQPFLFPPDVREWQPEDHLLHQHLTAPAS